MRYLSSLKKGTNLHDYTQPLFRSVSLSFEETETNIPGSLYHRRLQTWLWFTNMMTQFRLKWNI
jgi:hypothetical protein